MPADSAADNSASFGALAALTGAKVHFSCLAPGCLALQKAARRWGRTLTAAEAAAEWGPQTTVEAVRRRLRCTLCGHRGRHIQAEVSTPTPHIPIPVRP